MHPLRRLPSLASSTLLTALVGLAACGDSGTNPADAPPGTPDAPGPRPDAAAGGLAVSGTVSPAATAPVIALWETFGATDGLYKLGDGTATGATFSLDLDGPPPPAARNQYQTRDFGVALLVLLPSGTSVPDGPVNDIPAWIGLSGREAIVYRAPADSGTEPPWVSDFPLGLSCGRCVDNPAGFDSYAPVGCDQIAITDAPESAVCNWF